MARAKAEGGARPRAATRPGAAGGGRAAERRAIDRLRRLCLSFPEAVEKASHGEPTWFAGEKGKVFATLDVHHHRSEHVSVWVPLPLGVQEALVEKDPRRYFRPPYVGGRGWVAVVLDVDPDWAEVVRLLREGYLKVAGRRLAGRVGHGP